MSTEAFSPPSVIDCRDNKQVQYWTEELGVHVDQLGDVIQIVGPSAEALKDYLRDASDKRWCS